MNRSHSSCHNYTHSVFPISTDYVLENHLLLNSQEFDISQVIQHKLILNNFVEPFRIVMFAFFHLLCFLLMLQPLYNCRKAMQFTSENVVPRSRCFRWVSWKGEHPNVAATLPTPEMVSWRVLRASVRDLLFRDPNDFTAGKIHNHLRHWEEFSRVSQNVIRFCPMSSLESTFATF